MKILLPLLLVLVFTNGYSQVEGQDAQGNVTDMASGSMFRSFDNRFRGIEGFPTLYKSYCPGQITMITGKKVSYDSVNLDIYSNDLLVKRNNAESVFNRGLAKEFTMESEDEGTITFIKLKGIDGSESFFRMLASGRVKLLKHSYKTIAGPTNSGAYSTGRTHSIFVEKSKVYVQKDNDEMFELKNKKILLAQFPEKENEISTFIKDQKVNLKDEFEAVQLIEFMNTIL